MPQNNSILLETQDVTIENIATHLDCLQGCWKCSSLIWMQANHVSVLPGLILNAWTPESEEAVSRFCRKNNFDELLVRFEKPGQRWTSRRGGYTIPLSEVQRQVEELTSEELITILLEPASPYVDLYSLTSVCDFKTGKVDVEVVGPGFDASDVLRSDAVPHERFELFLGDEINAAEANPSVEAKRTYMVEDRRYRDSVQERLLKIGAKLRKPAFPDEIMCAAVSAAERESLARSAREFLQATGQTALLDHSEDYEPIPRLLLHQFLRELARIYRRAEAGQFHFGLLSIAASFLPNNRLVMWDFFPSAQVDTKVLSRL
jgi:hypothetical protein